MLKTVNEHYVKQGSTVTISALDISKSFDTVDRYALLNLLMDTQLPRNFIALLQNWLDIYYACVRWGGSLSYWYLVLCYSWCELGRRVRETCYRQFCLQFNLFIWIFLIVRLR